MRGAGAFDRAKLGLVEWICHKGAGAEVAPKTIAEGANVLVSMHWGPVNIVAPCRIVYVVDEPTAFGFAYGTLPGHPERGEELFIVEREEPDLVRLRIEAFSLPADPFVRAVFPIARWVQRRTTARYLTSLADFVEGGVAAEG